jgi:hypothetical protein
MTRGVVLEVRKIFSTARQGMWIEAAGALAGQKVKDLKGRPHLAVTTWRCTRCGLLESYAHE